MKNGENMMSNGDNGFEVNSSDIAIVGMAGRFPGAKDIRQFWNNLCQGIESKTKITKEDLKESGVDPGDFDLPGYVKSAFILEDFDRFDAEFFGYTAKEAKYMDPQQRVFLECAWEALEHSGYHQDKYNGLIGIFAGTGASTYFINNIYPNFAEKPSLIGLTETAFLNNPDHITTRVAYKLNLKGPAVTIQNACATSLVAVTIACQNLLLYQCDMALAGGVKIDVPQRVGYRVTPDMQGVFSTKGSIHAFSSDADGLAPGNGVAIVVLKRLEDALADNDTIHAIIKSAFINNDGTDKVGFTAPSSEGQARVLTGAYDIADIDPGTIDYIETHGTGTRAGDLIEMGALNRALGSRIGKKRSCAIGSVKTNIGHLDPAAGVAGLIKTTLALKHKQIPPSLHCKEQNPEIDFENSPFYVNTQLKAWPPKPDGGPRRAGVSSFGVGGTNAHVIVEEAPAYPPRQKPGNSKPRQILTLSAKNKEALEKAGENLLEHLQKYQDISLADTAYTLSLGRKDFQHRRMMVCQTTGEAIEMLTGKPRNRVFTSLVQPGKKNVIFLFPGAESESYLVGEELYKSLPCFRQQIDLCAEKLKPQLNLDISRFFSADKQTIKEEYQKHVSWPVVLSMIFACEYALAKLWISRGIIPYAMIGHSLGEYAAACLAGVFSLDDALKLVVYRARLFEALPRGAMTTVSLPAVKARQYVNDSLSIAAINAPSQCVFSGTVEAVGALEQVLEKQDIPFNRLEVSRAGHSPMVAPIRDKLKDFFKSICLKPPKIPYVSCMTGTWIKDEEAVDPGYWADHLGNTVRFSEGILELAKDSSGIFLEVGFGRTLSAFVKKHRQLAKERLVLTSTQHAKHDQSETHYLFETLGKLWLAGVKVDWESFYQNERRSRIPLPTYPFRRRYFWVRPPAGDKTAVGQSNENEGVCYHSYKRSLNYEAIGKENIAGETWLVLCDSNGLGEALAAKLQQMKARPIVVRHGQSANKTGDFEYTINPGKKTDYQRLFENLPGWPEKIVDLTGVFSHRDQVPPVSHFYLLARVVEKIANDKIKEILVVTNHHSLVSGDEPQRVDSIMTSALFDYLAKKSLLLRYRKLDLSIDGMSQESLDRAASRIICEGNLDTAEPMAACRGNYRWIPAIETFNHRAQKAGNKIRKNGVYLVTGGLEEWNFEGSRYLAQQSKGTLILLENWENRLPGESLQYMDFNRAQNDDNHFLPDIVDERHWFLERIAALEIEKNIKKIPEEAERLSEKLAASYILEYFSGKNIKTAAGHKYTKAVLREMIGFEPGTYESFFNFFIETMKQFCFLKDDGDEVEFLEEPRETPSAAAVRRQLEERHPGFKSACDVAEYFIRHYDKIISGEVDGVQVMYPEGKSDLLRQGLDIFTETTNRPVYAQVIAETVVKAVDRYPHRRWKILELGAGEGNITWPIVNFFKEKGIEDHIEYYYTDIGKSFVVEARKQAEEQEIDFMKCAVLDIVQDLESQGFDKYSFDFVISFNVIHATKNIAAALANIQKLLVPKGLTFLLETTKLRPMVGLILGIMEGWWVPLEDKEARLPNTPFLNTTLWIEALKKTGFTHVQTYPPPPAAGKPVKDSFVMIIGQQPGELNSDDYLKWRGEKNERKQYTQEQKIEKIKSLASTGAKVVIANIDCTSREQVQELNNQIPVKFGPVNGIVHTVKWSAPGLSDRTKNEKFNLNECHEWMQTEMQIIRHLERLISGDEKDFAFLFSPVGTPDADYFTLRRNVVHYILEYKANNGTGENKANWTGVNWHGTITGNAFAQLFPGQYPGSLLEVFSAVKDTEQPGQDSDTGQEKTLTENLTGEVEPGLVSRANMQTDYVAPESEIEKAIAKIWQEEFGESRVGVYDNFFDLGGESLLALKINAKMQERFKIKIALKDLFANPTISEFSKIVEKSIENKEKAPVSKDEPAAEDEIKPVSREKYRVKKSQLNLQ
jgi:acyl transferase domain-containing protein/acyl carrier protein